LSQFQAGISDLMFENEALLPENGQNQIRDLGPRGLSHFLEFRIFDIAR